MIFIEDLYLDLFILLIPLIGFYSGWSINRFLKLVSNGAIAGIVGIVFAHIIADFIAASS
jgi:uncharacterized membrane protein (DUF485 family)